MLLSCLEELACSQDGIPSRHHPHIPFFGHQLSGKARRQVPLGEGTVFRRTGDSSTGHEPFSQQVLLSEPDSSGPHRWPSSLPRPLKSAQCPHWDSQSHPPGPQLAPCSMPHCTQLHSSAQSKLRTSSGPDSSEIYESGIRALACEPPALGETEGAAPDTVACQLPAHTPW